MGEGGLRPWMLWLGVSPDEAGAAIPPRNPAGACTGNHPDQLWAIPSLSADLNLNVLKKQL